MSFRTFTLDTTKCFRRPRVDACGDNDTLAIWQATLISILKFSLYILLFLSRGWLMQFASLQQPVRTRLNHTLVPRPRSVGPHPPLQLRRMASQVGATPGSAPARQNSRVPTLNAESFSTFIFDCDGERSLRKCTCHTHAGKRMQHFRRRSGHMLNPALVVPCLTVHSPDATSPGTYRSCAARITLPAVHSQGQHEADARLDAGLGTFLRRTHGPVPAAPVRSLAQASSGTAMNPSMGPLRWCRGLG